MNRQSDIRDSCRSRWSLVGRSNSNDQHQSLRYCRHLDLVRTTLITEPKETEPLNEGWSLEGEVGRDEVGGRETANSTTWSWIGTKLSQNGEKMEGASNS